MKFHTETQNISADKITKNFWNPNFVSQNIMDAIRDDIQRHGFIGSIVVQKFNKKMNKPYVIINGEHRYDVLLEMKETMIPCNVLDCDDDTAEVLTLRLNREHGELMPDKVSKLLADLSSSNDLQKLQDITAIPMHELEILTSLNISDEELLRKLSQPAETAVEDTEETRKFDKRNIITSITQAEEAGEDADILLSWYAIDAIAKTLSDKIKSKSESQSIDCILAVTKGGLIPARLVSEYLGIDKIRVIPFENEVLQLQDMIKIDPRQHYLVVDDIIDTGSTIKAIQDSIFKDHIGYMVASLVVKDTKELLKLGQIIFGYETKADRWVVFPWEKSTEKLIKSEL